MPGLNGYFIADDFAYIHLFDQLDWRAVPLLFLGDWSMGIWRSPIGEYRPPLGALLGYPFLPRPWSHFSLSSRASRWPHT